MQSTRPGVFFGGDAAWGPKNIIWAVAHGHQAAISIHNHCQGIPVTERPPHGMNLVSQKMGLSEWSYHNDYNPAPRQKMKHVDLARRFEQLEHRSGAGLHRRADRARGAALPQLRHRDGVHAPSDASSATRASTSARVQCLTITPDGDEGDVRDASVGAGREPDAGPLRLDAAAADRTR